MIADRLREANRRGLGEKIGAAGIIVLAAIFGHWWPWETACALLAAVINNLVSLRERK